ncbi:hypothetical protein Elgi_67400 [Paenibacillus elgii]|uniref:hypothetical protein n=1 Tax=Paenibacillus elgii TaxID=189691 RepID=UPI002D7D7EA3|nr:hypothetical protein Elgi_67400 [Paenibacillus elgii]
MYILSLSISLMLIFGGGSLYNHLQKPDDRLNVEQLKNPLGDNLNIQDASSMFEKKFNKKVLIPNNVPFKPTDTGASFSEIAKTLTISYFNKETNQSLIVTQMVNIKPKDDKKFKTTAHETEVVLNDGTKAVYVYNSAEEKPSHLRFIRDDVVYFITIKQNHHNATIDELVNIANSMKTFS